MRRWVVSVFGLMLILALIAGCQSEKDNNQSNNSIPNQKVTVGLYWWPSIEFAPVYASLKEGYFAEENLDVELMHGGYDNEDNYIEMLPRLLSGEADFITLMSDQVMQARAQGQPVVAIASLYQRFPNALASLESSGIKTPTDLKGKRIILWGEDGSYDMFLHQTGLSPDDVTEITDGNLEGGYNLNQLIEGKGDAILVFINMEFLELQNLVPDQKINTMLFFDYGVGGYPNLICTTEAMIREKPEVVQAFVNALVRGLRYSVGNPDVTADYFMSNLADENTTVGPDVTRAIMRASLPLYNPAGSTPGQMEASVWESQYTTLQEMDKLPAGLDWEKSFTLRFLENVAQ